MADHIQQYLDGKTDLPALVVGLEALLNALEVPDVRWNNEFRRKWEILEEVNAVSLNEVEEGASPTIDAVLDEPEIGSSLRKRSMISFAFWWDARPKLPQGINLTCAVSRWETGADEETGKSPHCAIGVGFVFLGKQT